MSKILKITKYGQNDVNNNNQQNFKNDQKMSKILIITKYGQNDKK